MGIHTLFFLPEAVDLHAPTISQNSIMFALGGALLLLVLSARYNRRTQF